MKSLDLDALGVCVLSCMVTFRLAARDGVYSAGRVPGWTRKAGSGWAVGSERLLDGPAHSRVTWVSWLSHPLPASVSLAEHTNLAISTSRVALGIT